MPQAFPRSPGPQRARSAEVSPILAARARLTPARLAGRGVRVQPASALSVEDGSGTPSAFLRGSSPSQSVEERATCDSAFAVAAALRKVTSAATSDLSREQSPRLSPVHRRASATSPIVPRLRSRAGTPGDGILAAGMAGSCTVPLTRGLLGSATVPSGPVSSRSLRAAAPDTLRSSRSQPAYAFSRMFSAPSRSVLGNASGGVTQPVMLADGATVASPPAPIPMGSPMSSPSRQRALRMPVSHVPRRTVGKPVRRPQTHGCSVMTTGGSSVAASAMDDRVSAVPPVAIPIASKVFPRTPQSPLPLARMQSTSQIRLPARSVSPLPRVSQEDSMLAGSQQAWGPHDALVREAWARRNSWAHESSPEARSLHSIPCARSPTSPLASRALLSGAASASVLPDSVDQFNSKGNLCSEVPSGIGTAATTVPSDSSPNWSLVAPTASNAGGSTAATSSRGVDAATTIEASLVVQPQLPESLRMSMDTGKRWIPSAAVATSSPRMDMSGLSTGSRAGSLLLPVASAPQLTTGLVHLEQDAFANEVASLKAGHERAVAQAGARLFVTAFMAFSEEADDDRQLQQMMREMSVDLESDVSKEPHMQPQPQSSLFQPSSLLLNVIVSPYGVLGTQLSRTGQTRVNAPEPGPDVAIVDSVCMHALRSGPGRADSQGIMTYSWLGFMMEDAYPPVVSQAIRVPSDAQFIDYEGRCACIHVVEPNFTDDPCNYEAAVIHLASAYRNVFSEFAASRASTLRLLPVSSTGTSPGAFRQHFPALTAEALEQGFMRLQADEQRRVFQAERIEMCIFMEKDLEAYEKAWEASGLLPNYCDISKTDSTHAREDEVPRSSPSVPTLPVESSGINEELADTQQLGQEMDAVEIDQFFADLADFDPQASPNEGFLGGTAVSSSGETLMHKKIDEETEASSVGGWTSEGDDEVYPNLGPMCSHRSPLQFRPGVPMLRLPPPGWGTPGSPYDEAAAAQVASASAAAPRTNGQAGSQRSEQRMPQTSSNASPNYVCRDSHHAQVPNKTMPTISANLGAVLRPARASTPAVSQCRSHTSLQGSPDLVGARW